MLNRFITASKRFSREKGQGLVEYALLLVLVAVVTILVVGLLGGQVQQQFCVVLAEFGDMAPNVDACNAPQVSCVPHLKSAGRIEVQAVVTVGTPTDSVDRVDFYVNGVLKTTEHQDNYCLGATDNCATSTGFGSGIDSGYTYTVQATATTAEGYTGSCTVTVTAP